MKIIIAFLCIALLIVSPGCIAAKTITQTVAATTITQWTAATTVTTASPPVTSVLTQPAVTNTVTQPPVYTTVTSPPVVTTIIQPVVTTVTAPPVTNTVTTPPVTTTVTQAPVTTTVTFTPTVTLTAKEAIEVNITPFPLGEVVEVPDIEPFGGYSSWVRLSYHNTTNKAYSVKFKITLYVVKITLETGDGVTLTSASGTPIWTPLTTSSTIMVYQTISSTAVAANAEGEIILLVAIKYNTGNAGYLYPEVEII